jgi:hypothetical protein
MGKSNGMKAGKRFDENGDSKPPAGREENFFSHGGQGAFDLRRRCQPCRYRRIAPAASALPQTKIPPAIRKFLSAFGINESGRQRNECITVLMRSDILVI